MRSGSERSCRRVGGLLDVLNVDCTVVAGLRGSLNELQLLRLRRQLLYQLQVARLSTLHQLQLRHRVDQLQAGSRSLNELQVCGWQLRTGKLHLHESCHFVASRCSLQGDGGQDVLDLSGLARGVRVESDELRLLHVGRLPQQSDHLRLLHARCLTSG